MRYNLSKIEEILKLVDPACVLYYSRNIKSEKVLSLLHNASMHVYPDNVFGDGDDADCYKFVVDSSANEYMLLFRKQDSDKWEYIY